MPNQREPQGSVHVSGGHFAGANIAIGNVANVQVSNSNEFPFDALLVEIARLRVELNRTGQTPNLAVVVAEADAAARDCDEGRLKRALLSGGQALLALARETGAAFTAEQIVRLLHG